MPPKSFVGIVVSPCAQDLGPALFQRRDRLLRELGTVGDVDLLEVVEQVDAFSARLLLLLGGLASNAVFRIARENCLASGIDIRPAAMAKLLDDWVPRTALRIAESWQLPPELCATLAAPEAADGSAHAAGL